MRATVAALGFALLGCSPSLDAVALQFRAELLEERDEREWSVARTRTGSHRVTLRHALRSGNPCSQVSGVLARAGRDFTLRVHAGAGSRRGLDASVCRYTAVIHNLPSGHYRLRVVHTGVGTGSAEVVLDHPIHAR